MASSTMMRYLLLWVLSTWSFRSIPRVFHGRDSELKDATGEGGFLPVSLQLSQWTFSIAAREVRGAPNFLSCLASASTFRWPVLVCILDATLTSLSLSPVGSFPNASSSSLVAASCSCDARDLKCFHETSDADPTHPRRVVPAPVSMLS